MFIILLDTDLQDIYDFIFATYSQIIADFSSVYIFIRR